MTAIAQPAIASDSSEELLRERVGVLEDLLERSRAETRAAYSALLAISMDARLEDGTPVLTLALRDNPELKRGLERVFLNPGN